MMVETDLPLALFENPAAIGGVLRFALQASRNDNCRKFVRFGYAQPIEPQYRLGDLILAQLSPCISTEFDDDAKGAIKNLQIARNENIREKTLLHTLHHDDLSLEWDARNGLLPKVQLKENARSKTIDLQFRYPTGNARQSKVIGRHYAPEAMPL